MAKFISEGGSIEAVILDHGEKLKTFHLNPRTGTSWEANLFVELVKHASGAWPVDRFDKQGRQMLLMQDPEVLVARALEIVKRTVEAMRENGWSIQLPTASELIEESGGRTGFVVNNPHGKAANGTELPAQGRASAADRGPRDTGDQGGPEVVSGWADTFTRF